MAMDELLLSFWKDEYCQGAIEGTVRFPDGVSRCSLRIVDVSLM
jgi:hypothetical protein